MRLSTAQPKKQNIDQVVEELVKRPYKLDNPTRHLLYHIWPNKINTNVLEWNIDRLLKYINIFNGVRSIGIVVDENTLDEKDIIKLFGETRIDNWLVLPNNPKHREGVTFEPLMKTIPKGGQNITFYGHAKGVSRKYEDEGFTRRWTDLMYKYCLSDINKVIGELSNYPITGCFKRTDEFTLPNHHCWHYSGTFYWFRNYDVFRNRNWNDICKTHFACIEAWPARIFPANVASCLFGNNPGNLYESSAWEKLDKELNNV